MEYRIQGQNPEGSSYRLNNYNQGSMSYEFQNSLYERVIRYSRMAPKGEYMNGSGVPKI